MDEPSIHWTPLLLNNDTRARTGRPTGPTEPIAAATLPAVFDAIPPNPPRTQAPMTVIYRVQRGSAS